MTNGTGTLLGQHPPAGLVRAGAGQEEAMEDYHVQDMQNQLTPHATINRTPEKWGQGPKNTSSDHPDPRPEKEREHTMRTE